MFNKSSILDEPEKGEAKKWHQDSFTSNHCSRELNHILCRLTQGSVLTKFYHKNKPERRFFCVNREFKQLLWYKSVEEKDVLENYIDLREVKEIRFGSCSKLFEGLPEELKKWNTSQCFTILYGNAFRLKTLSCIGKFIFNSINKYD